MRLTDKHSIFKQQIAKELEELAPTLAQIERREPEVAEYYFHTIADKMVRKVTEEAPAAPQSWLDVAEQFVLRVLSPAVLKVAAAVLVVGTVSLSIYQAANTGVVSTQPEALSMADLSENDVNMLITDENYGGTEFLLTDEDLDELGNQVAFQTISDNISDDDLNNFYLNDINESLILEEVLL